MTRSFDRRLVPVLAPILLLELLGALPIAALAGKPPVSAADDPPAMRPAPPPSPLDRARVMRWRDAWREEAAGLERTFSAAVQASEARDDDGLRPRCVALAGALLELERPRVLPVPDRAADLHVRRALRHLTRAAVACLSERPYAARHALEQARDAFGQARRVLRRYRLPDDEPREPASGPSDPR
jgi:hypothetical protein